MTPEVPYQAEIAVAILRVITGVLFLFQGYDKLFNVGIRGVYNTFQKPMADSHIPGWVLWSSAWFTTITELFGGIMLIGGILTGWAVVFLLVDLLLVVAAFSSIRSMWDMRHIFPRLIFLMAIALMPFQLHLFSIDYLLFK